MLPEPPVPGLGHWKAGRLRTSATPECPVVRTVGAVLCHSKRDDQQIRSDLVERLRPSPTC